MRIKRDDPRAELTDLYCSTSPHYNTIFYFLFSLLFKYYLFLVK